MSTCVVQLDNYRDHYIAGNLIQGRVICVFNKQKNVRGIRIKLKGEEHNRWTGTESYYDTLSRSQKTRTVHYYGNNTFLHVENTLSPGGDIGPGRYEYPFSLQLPTRLPGTYKGHYGGVDFTISAKADRPFMPDYKDSKQIVVISLIDFNKIRDELQLNPVGYSIDRNLGCCCCTSDPLTMNVQLEKEAFALGEPVKVKVDITNMSNVSIERVDVKIRTKIISMVQFPKSDSKSNNENVASAHDSGVGAHGQRTYNFELEIPRSTPVYNFDMCQLFSKRTKLKVVATVPGCHKDLGIFSYITLGHVPLYATQPNYQGAQMYPPPSYSTNAIVPPYPPSDTSSYLPPYQPPDASPMGFSVPKGAGPGPSVPLQEDGASAPPTVKEGEPNDFLEVDSKDPPSYNEAVSHFTKQ